MNDIYEAFFARCTQIFHEQFYKINGINILFRLVLIPKNLRKHTQRYFTLLTLTQKAVLTHTHTRCSASIHTHTNIFFDANADWLYVAYVGGGTPLNVCAVFPSTTHIYQHKRISTIFLIQRKGVTSCCYYYILYSKGPHVLIFHVCVCHKCVYGYETRHYKRAVCV